MEEAAARIESATSKPQVQTVEDVAEACHSRSARARDKAADLLEATGERVIVSAADSQRIKRKIDLKILPILLVVYFLQQLDKTTLAYASVFGLIQDTNLKGEDYSWLGSIVYVAQLVVQPLVAYILIRAPIGKVCAAVVLGWGAVLCCMAAAHDFTGLIVTRFFLGAFEGFVAPAFVAVTQMWWRRSEQTNRMSAWYAMNGVTNMLGSLISYGVGHIKSGSLHSYQIIFLLCGCVTVAFAPVIFLFLPDSPLEAKFLSKDDKLMAVERLRANQMGVGSQTWKGEHLKECMLDPKTLAWFAMIFSISIPSGGISTFGPLIIQSFGFDSFTTILFNIPFGFVQLCATVGGAFVATRFKKKGPILVFLCIPPILGCIILLCVNHVTGSKAVLLVGCYLVSVYPALLPLIYSWSSQNTAGDTKKKCTNAVLFIGQSAGNIIGPHLYTTAEAPGYRRGLISNLSLFVVLIVLVLLTTVYLYFLNRDHAKRRVAMGKRAVVIDTSMSAIRDVDTTEVAFQKDGIPSENIETGQTVAAAPEGSHATIGDKAFDDETDLRNEDFVFVY